MATQKNYTISTPYYKVNESAFQTKSLEDMQAERYFADVYHVFLSRLTKFVQDGETSEADYKKLTSFFNQVVELKQGLEKKAREARGKGEFHAIN